MNAKNKIEANQIRTFGMNWGTVVGCLSSVSFVCSMYGFRYAAAGLLSNLLGVAAVIVVGHAIRKFRHDILPITFGQACRLSISIFFYAILLTALAQYIYFAYLDHGTLVSQMRTILDMPEYRQLLKQMAGTEEVDTMIQGTIETMRSPARATMQLMWMNCIIALLLTPVTALIGITGKKNKGIED